MKHSIRRQFSIIFIGVMAGTILLLLLANNLFLGRYYEHRKQRVIFDAYDSIKQAAGSDSYGSDQFQQELEQVCRSYNISICIMDVQSKVKYVSTNGGKELEARLLGYIFAFPMDVVEVLQTGDEYSLQRTNSDGIEYLELCGRLDSGISFLMRTPMESITESARLANTFFIYVGCIGALAGAIIFWIVSRRITKPILELNRISEQMVQLDFEAKYQGKDRNEVDLLGENINKLSETLEKAISELKTANNELKKDIAQKEEIDEMRKEFLANVSHELKTPIALIQGYAEGLQEGIDDDSESRDFYCEVIVDEAGKMNRMVQQLMALNQIEFGTDVVSMERFDVVEMIENYLQSVTILVRQKDVQVKIDSYDPIYVWADEFRTEEVFANYFTNAVNHCEKERIISIDLEQLEGKVRVKVFNTGEPIPEEALEHLWEKFYKVDKARSREYGGSGVGLSIVKAIMDSMHQQYGVENYKNGVLFWFELELVQEKIETDSCVVV